MRDRTHEFQAAVESMLSHSGPGNVVPIETQRLVTLKNTPNGAQATSEFTRAAASIGRDINSTVTKLQKLARLAKRKTLFDDRPVEINELIYIIKQDIAKINQQISQLSQWTRNGGGRTGGQPALAAEIRNKQMQEHSSNVITSLQSRLATTSTEFKNILEIRTENMKEQKTRKEQYISNPIPGAGTGTPGQTPGNSIADSPLYNPLRHSALGQQTASSYGDGSVIIDFGGADSGSGAALLQQQQLVPNSSVNMEIIESRSQAIESIEATIAELGQIYQNFASMIASQRQMVQRIDENVLDIEMNVTGAHSQLLKYYHNISSNRWLMIKVFAVLLVFFLIFVIMT
ncbi:t-SNARE [Gaertneriomyces semiglobifer]|nr:t-SNARE [Gaertneriomyces semiglobifer]